MAGEERVRSAELVLSEGVQAHHGPKDFAPLQRFQGTFVQAWDTGEGENFMKVESVMGSVGLFHVESRSKRDADSHLVDVLSDECGCRDWVCNHRRIPHYRCAHLEAARQHCLTVYLEAMREAQLSQ